MKWRKKNKNNNNKKHKSIYTHKKIYLMKKINGHNHFIENLFKPDIFKIIIKNLYETHYITSGMTKKNLYEQ